MSDDQTPTRGGVAHARPLTRRQQKLARPQQKTQSVSHPSPQPKPKPQPAMQAKDRPSSSLSRTSAPPAQPRPTGARTTQPQEPSPTRPRGATASVPQAQRAPAATSANGSAASTSRARRAPANSHASPAPTPAPASTPAPPVTSAAPAGSGAPTTGSRKHPTLAVMATRAPAPQPAPFGVGAAATNATGAATPLAPAESTESTDTGAPGADATPLTAMPAVTVAGQVAPQASDESAEPSVDDEPTNVLHMPARSRVETLPIAALEIMRRLPTHADTAPGDDDGDEGDAAADSMRARSGRKQDAFSATDDIEVEGPPTLPTALIPLRTYSRPLGERSGGRRQGLLARFGHIGAERASTAEETNLNIPIAATHAVVSVVAALAAAMLAVMAPVSALWALALALVAGLGAGLGFVASQRGDQAQGALWLLLSELGMLAWGLGALGPRPALVTLSVGGVALALRTRGRTTATCVLVGALTLYAASLIATFAGMWRAPLALGALPGALLDAVCVAVGLTLALGAMAGWANRRAKAEAAAQASQHEAAFVRRGASVARERTEADAERLARALGAAAQGRGLARGAHADGPLSPLAETINVTAERIVTLQRDREDRLRLEGALTGVLHAVERAWLGLSWSWPDPTGTPLDDLVALLRAPRPQDVLQDTRSTPSGEYGVVDGDDELSGLERGSDGDTAANGAHHRWERSSAPAAKRPGVRDATFDADTRLARFPDDEQPWPEDAPDPPLADFATASASPQTSFPVVEIYRRSAPAAETLPTQDPAIVSYDALEAFDTSEPIGASAWESTRRSWPSWPDPWADEDDDPDDSASRHVTPPPIRRRWNEWSSQPDDQGPANGREVATPPNQQQPKPHDGDQ